MKSPILIAFVLIVGVGSQAGCFKFFQTVYVPAMDADAESFVYVEQAHGNVLTLRGGGTVTIDELSVEGLSEFQLKMCGQYLARVSRYPESASQVNLPHNGLLIRETESSKKALLSVPFCDIRLHSCGFRPINIFPIRKEIPPEHVDIVECILLAGLGKCNLFVIEDPIRRERYLKAQKYAETMSLGVWASLGEQLLQAVAAGDVDEIERLLDDGASLGYVGKSYDACLPPGPIHDISSGRYDLIPRQNRYPLQTPLIVALLSGQIEMVAILLHKGADVNQVVQDKNKHEGLSARALHYCRGTRQYSGNYLNTIKMLVEYGADVAAADADLRLISIAEFYNARWDIIDYLRSRGARIDGFDPKANGPQCLMGSISNTTSMRRLIGLGADVNGLTDMGVYPLSWAVSRNRVEVVRILLEAGAIPNQIDCRSLTPLAYTSKHKNSKMIDLLKSYGAK